MPNNFHALCRQSRQSLTLNPNPLLFHAHPNTAFGCARDCTPVPDGVQGPPNMFAKLRPTPMVGKQRIVTSMPVRVCLCVCPRAHLQNCTPIFANFLYMLLMAVARSFACGVAISYVLPALWTTSSLHIMARNRQR